MKKNLFLSLAVFVLLLVGLPSFLLISIKNAKSCEQFVIDNYEVISGINIPKQTASQCYYVEKERIRLGIYQIPHPENFIAINHLKQLGRDEEVLLWSQRYLGESKLPIPHSRASLFQVQGDHKGNRWQCLLDKNSGKMWFEVKWEE